MRIAHVRELHAAAGAPWRLAAALGGPAVVNPDPPRWLDLEVARRRLAAADPRRAHNSVLFRQPVTTLDDHLSRGLRVEALAELVDGMATAGADAEIDPDDDAVLGAGDLRFGPPILRPPAFRDFYTFEQHVGSVWARRGGVIPENWYRIPVFYLSNVSELRGPGDPVWAPRGSAELDFELEVGALVDTPAFDLPEERAEEAIGGFFVLNDWSARDLQRDEMPVRMGPAKGKDFATSLGPWLVTPDEVADARAAGSTGPDLAMTSSVRGADGRKTTVSAGTWAASHYSFGQMLARASADVHIRAGELLGIRDGRLGLSPRDEGRDARPVARAGRRGLPLDRSARDAPLAGRDPSRPMSVSPAEAPGALTFRELPPGLDTPRLVIDLARVEANIDRLQRALDARRIALRPHAKTHKSVHVGRLQLEAGARGLTVGTLGEAEEFVGAGLSDLFIAYPVWAAGPKAARLRALHETAPELRVGVDSVGGAERLAAAVAGSTAALEVLVEIDPGTTRTGVVGSGAALDVARAARAHGLSVVGVFSHGGHGYSPGAGAGAGADEVRTLTEAAEALERDGFRIDVVSAGSTPTMLSAAAGRVNEIRAGTYVFGDRIQWLLGAIPAEGCAAAVAATVVSSFKDRLVVDAGAKALTKDRPDWLVGYGAIVGYPDLVVERLSDYHGVVGVPSGADRPALGDVVPIVPNHVCPVVDLGDGFTVLAGDGSIEDWPVDARGRSG